MTIDRISAEAARVMRRYDERDPERLAQCMDILVRREPMGTSKNSCKGFFLCQSRIRLITVNSELDEQTARIILAHELGHAVLHHEAAKNSAFGDFSLYEETTRFEYEANLFAADILLEDDETIRCLMDSDSFFSAAMSLGVPPEMLDFKFRLLKSRGMGLESPILSRSDFLKNITKK